MAFPNFSNIHGYVSQTLNSRKNDPKVVSGLSCWVKLASGVGDGLILYSNPDYALFQASGDAGSGTVYGNKSQAGTLGITWGGAAVASPDGAGRPSPIVTNMECDEGAGNISRKLNFTIRCFTLGQLDLIMQHYLEPGFTIFAEWGWNTAQGVSAKTKLDAASVGAYQDMKTTEQRRSSTNGLSDVYLGFITGGSINTSDTYWDVNVKCTGFTELPTYFMAADNMLTATDKANTKSDKPPGGLEYNVSGIFSFIELASLDYRRWQFAFNELPSNRRTGIVKTFGEKFLKNAAFYVNFDSEVTENINSKTEGSFWSGIFGDGKSSVVVAGDEGTQKVDMPEGTKLASEEKFIKFGVLVDIMNTVAAKGYVIGGKTVKFKINTTNTVCSAFPKIFSTDKSKLFIPNEKTPAPDFSVVAKSGTVKDFSGTTDNSVKFKNTTVSFPYKGTISGGSAGGRQIDYNLVGSRPLQKAEGRWGFLNDLYINFAFAKGILETKNFLIKDALYQMLNGMSSAAGGMWDFQIQEAPNAQSGLTELRVVDMNLISDGETVEAYAFNLSGPDSIFIDASFDMDIGGAMMNQIIASRTSDSVAVNTSSPVIQGKLFAKGKSDIVLNKIEQEKQTGEIIAGQKADDKNVVGAEGQEASDEVKAEIEKKFATFFEKVCLVPKVDVLAKDAKWDDKVYDKNYLAAYNDQVVFENLKVGQEIIDIEGGKSTSILLPIKFKFTVHGVSGFRRGDKFRVIGIPDNYSTGGFFQVLSVKHIIDGMIWKTEVEGGFRQVYNAAK